MIYLLSAIVGSALIPVLFRGFADWRIHLGWAIPVNYLTCAATGSLWAGQAAPLAWFGAAWFPLAALQGVILAVNFFLLAYTAQRAGVSVAALASRLSVALPALAAFLVYGDSLSAVKIAGLAAALVSLYLVTGPETRRADAAAPAGKFLPLVVFASFGCYFFVVKYAQARYLDPASFHPYVICGFLIAFVASLAIGWGRGALTRADFGVRHVAAGGALGVVNYVAVYALVRALASDGWQSSELYPIYSVGVVSLSTLLALVLFAEKLSRRRWAGLLLGLVAVGLLNR